MTSAEQGIDEWRESLLREHANRREAIENAYQQMENAGLISKVTVHRYVCRRQGCGVLATVIRVGGATIARTGDYKMSPGMNRERTVESARQRNTLDGDRHWPGHTYDVSDLAVPGVGVDMSCRHEIRTIPATDIVAAVQGVTPGHPGKPTVL